ncbi:hypothetical protein FF38_04076 [Lucilia cuprina]|uniref:Uncharacterized protein n=1 Tax=Lucilia cuprina TaxID=7375 RepID=A0A0L0BU31_LUCCU|nr:hypothetical protein FF38_04076 [Lucilia cuprina]
MENLAKFPASSEAKRKHESSTRAMSCGAGVNSAAGAVGGGVNATTGIVVNTPPVSAHTSTWLAALHVNNNNNTEKSFTNPQQDMHKCKVNPKNNLNTTTTNSSMNSSLAWQCDSCDTYQKNGTSSLNASSTLARVTLNEEDEGGGTVGDNTIEKLPLSYNGSALASAAPDINSPDAVAAAAATAANTASFLQTETDYVAYDMCGAVSLSPPLLEDHFAISATGGAGIGGGHSNRTSLNNSTENLSYISDNFYGDDDLILLEEDIDVEAEELSLNSDDCIYAYRGEGAEFDLPLRPLTGVGGNFGLLHGCAAVDEETDFLEMDFEPDPLSELEYNQAQRNCSNDNNDQYLMQRDACHLVTPTQRHQLFSSPIDDLPPAPKALQAQSLLTKNFARITLHLDQIQKDYNEDLSDEGRERLNSALESRPLEEEFASDNLTADTSHSLPNTLHEHFTNRCNSESAVVNSTKDCSLAAPLQTLAHKSPSKITGAKPKRLSTFSSTSSTSSKNSSKSRNSLRSAFQTTNTLGTSCSFDERSVSCSEFRTERDLSANTAATSKQPLLSSAPHTAPSTAAILNPEFNAFTDDTCLDCLEKEFLANTIGKALDPQGCLKCRKRLGHLSLYNTTRSSTEHSKYRRSASPTTTFFFNDQPSPTSRLFSCEFLNSQARKRQEWDCYVQESKENDTISGTKATTTTTTTTGVLNANATATIAAATKNHQPAKGGMVDIKDLNQSLKNLESKLLKNLKPPDPCSVTLSTQNLNETCLVQALVSINGINSNSSLITNDPFLQDKLQVAYNPEILRKCLKKYNKNYFSSSSTNISKTLKEFYNLKDFLMYVSKRPGNYLKLQRIIGKATQKQILVQFKKDPSINTMEMVTVKVSDILYYWSQHKNLDILKDMDKRYQDTNILGKIANIIRQAHQRSSCSSRRPLPEYISIPQYYPSGFLTLTKQC